MTLLNFLLESLAFGATFIYGSTGEIITEKAGHTLAWLREYNAWYAEHESDLPY